MKIVFKTLYYLVCEFYIAFGLYIAITTDIKKEIVFSIIFMASGLLFAVLPKIYKYI